MFPQSHVLYYQKHPNRRSDEAQPSHSLQASATGTPTAARSRLASATHLRPAQVGDRRDLPEDKQNGKEIHGVRCEQELPPLLMRFLESTPSRLPELQFSMCRDSTSGASLTHTPVHRMDSDSVYCRQSTLRRTVPSLCRSTRVPATERYTCSPPSPYKARHGSSTGLLHASALSLLQIYERQARLRGGGTGPRYRIIGTVMKVTVPRQQQQSHSLNNLCLFSERGEPAPLLAHTRPNRANTPPQSLASHSFRDPAMQASAINSSGALSFLSSRGTVVVRVLTLTTAHSKRKHQQHVHVHAHDLSLVLTHEFPEDKRKGKEIPRDQGAILLVRGCQNSDDQEGLLPINLCFPDSTHAL
ncbi:hypothetical protein DXG01_008870 [Tephrocybe rancida]|nr:hypothetical protein DXG01_008870 [Tephrocybe rancida]